jgi:CRP-like cAMP-binding protein
MPIKKELGPIADLEAGARVFPIGSELYRQGDPCSAYFIVLKGWIAQSMLLDDGSCQILDFALPGAVLGFQQAPNTPMYHSARCLSVVRVCMYPRRKLDMIIETNPRLAVLLWRQVTADGARAHDHLANIGLRDARQRIAHLLVELYVRIRHRLPAERGETIQLPLSQGHIGQALGLTYVHVWRTLHTLKKQSIVRLANHKLEIIDPASLIAAAGIETDDPGSLVRPKPTPAAAASPFALDAILPAGWMPVQTEHTVLPSRASASTDLAFTMAKAA